MEGLKMQVRGEHVAFTLTISEVERRILEQRADDLGINIAALIRHLIAVEAAR